MTPTVDDRPAGPPGGDDLATLQRRVLIAALEGQPVAGSEVPVPLPDGAWLVVGGHLQLARDGLAGREVVAGLEPAVRLVDVDPDTPGPTAYARIRSDVLASGEVQVTLESRLASGRGGAGATSSSAVTVTFARVGEEWQPTSGPVQVAG